MGANDRYVIVDHPPAAPGTCFTCRSNSRGPFVDTKVTDPYLGVFYICIGCLTDMWAQWKKDESISLDEQIAIRLDEARNDGFIQGVNALKESINDTAALFIDRSIVSDTSDVSDPSLSEPPTVPRNSQREDGSRDSTDSTSKQSVSAAKRSGRDDVPSDPSNGPAFDLGSI